LLYHGQADNGRKFVKGALQNNPDNVEYIKFWKALTKMDRIKSEGDAAQRLNEFEEAVQKYDECLGIDPLN